LFGWVSKETGYRRFLEAYIEVARKNAKSTWAAAIGLFAFTSDAEPGAEVYCGATTKKQAMEVFRTAWRMAKKSPEFCERFGIEINKESLVIQDDGSKFEPLVGDPGDGASPSCAILDERHEHSSDNLHDTMVTGMGARRQGLTVNITTAGTDTEGVCYAQRRDCERILDGYIEDDSTFVMIFTIDKDDDPKSEIAQRKANPNFGVSVYPEYLQKQLRNALKSPHAMFIYKTKHLCVWGNAPDSYFDMEAWEKCKDRSLSIAEFAGKPCWQGVDLAAKVDLASRVRIFKEIKRDAHGNQATHYYLFGTHYAPHDRVMDGDHAHYERWVESGFLTAIPGPEIQLSQIQLDIEAELALYDFQCIAFDPWSAQQMQQELALKTKADVVLTIPQTVQYLSDPMKELNAAILAGRVHHNGDPVLTFGISCVLAKQDRNENVFPRKLENGKNKIDPISATLNGLNRAMVGDVKRPFTRPSIGLL
jgi:phage terminase large subunit-like protein